MCTKTRSISIVDDADSREDERTEARRREEDGGDVRVRSGRGRNVRPGKVSRVGRYP